MKLITVFQIAFFIFLATVVRAQNNALGARQVVTPTSAQRVLMIGDSMTVGDFGEALQEYLIKHCGKGSVAIYASCGSSPEHWLKAEPVFVTRCGYRQYTEGGPIVVDFVGRRPPQPVPTPKLEDLLVKHRPSVVIVQLGTNWMQSISEKPAEEAKCQSILERFATALRGSPGTVRQVIWITPPDSSHYSNQTMLTVDDLLKSAAKKHAFDRIVSSAMTHYTAGKTGGDGIHYRKEEAVEWAHRVTRELDRKLR